MRIKNLVFILALCFVTCFSTKAFAEERGTCGDNLTWVLDDEGTLTISGTGKMADYSFEDGQEAPWDEYASDMEKLVIEDGVENIGTYAFFGCYGLTEMTIADTVERIEQGGLSNIPYIESITLPDSVEFIGDSAFEGCEILKNVKFSENVTYIGEEAFLNCWELSGIELPKKVEHIGADAFANCYKLETINVPEDNAFFCSIDGVLFDKSKKIIIRFPAARTGTYTIPDGVETIGYGSFKNCGLTKIDIPVGVKYIESFAFYNTKFSTLILPSGLLSIDAYMGENLNLKSIEIPASIEYIQADALVDFDNLTDIYYYGTEEQWQTVKDKEDLNLPPGAVVHYNWKKRFPQTITAANKTVTISAKPFNLGAKVSGQGEELGKLTYVSSAKSVATVSATGVITPKGYGKTFITIKAAQTDSSKEATKKVAITVLPRKMTLGTPKSPAKKTILIKWTKDRSVTGYQVQLCQKNNFKTGTLSRNFGVKVVKTKIYPVKKKTWYVRIRSYKTVRKTNYYGAWSAVKKVKVK